MRHPVRTTTTGIFAEPAQNAGRPIPVMLEYDPSDPLAARITFGDLSAGGAEWLVGRDLLWEGLSRRTGEGDVRAWPGMDGKIFVSVDSPFGHAAFGIPKGDLRDFLAQAYTSCPPGTEYTDGDIEHELAAFFDSKEY